jgi:hypothetical protein
MLIPKLNQLLPHAKGELAAMVRFGVFIFGKFAATLVRGGGRSDFEDRYFWLIRSNLDLIDSPDLMAQIASSEPRQFPDPRIELFLASAAEPIQQLYARLKPQMNKKLPDDVLELDQFALVAFAKHLRFFTELSHFTGSTAPSPILKRSFDQVLRVRNHYRALKQAGSEHTDWIRIKCLILMRLSSEELTEPELLTSFIISPFPPDLVGRIISAQRHRIETTLVGFALLGRTQAMGIDPLFLGIVSFALSGIEDFEGLASILKITRLTQQQQIRVTDFFNRILSVAHDKCARHLFTMSLKFFRDVTSLQEIQTEFLTGVMTFALDNQSIPCLALALALMPTLTAIPDVLVSADLTRPFTLLLLSEATHFAAPSADFVEILTAIVWEVPASELRLHLRALYWAIDKLDRELQTGFFRDLVVTIGHAVLGADRMDVQSEFVYFARRILSSDHASKPLFMAVLFDTDVLEVAEPFLLGLLAILDSVLEALRPGVHVYAHISRSESRELLVIQKASALAFYRRPFVIGDQPVPFHRSTSLYWRVVPFVDLDFAQLPKADWIFSAVHRAFELSLAPVTFAFCLHVFARYCRSTDFVAQVPVDLLPQLFRLWTPFHDLRRLLAKIGWVKTVPTAPEVCGFAFVANDNPRYYCLVSPVVRQDAPVFRMVVDAFSRPFTGFIGVLSYSTDAKSVRYSLMQVPDGLAFPMDRPRRSFPQSVPSVSIDITPSRKSFVIGGTRLELPVGAQHRLIVAAPRELALHIDLPLYAHVFTADGSYWPRQSLLSDYRDEHLFEPVSWLSRFSRPP